MMSGVQAVIDTNGLVLGFVGNSSTLAGRQKTKDFSYRIDLRSNLAFLDRGQELINLKFKGNKQIKESKVSFTEGGDFIFSIKGIVFKKTKSLKEMTTYLAEVLEL